MNRVAPHAWLASTLIATVIGHKQSQINDLLPWNYAIKVISGQRSDVFCQCFKHAEEPVGGKWHLFITHIGGNEI
jgi:hypothetical protein